MKPFLSQQSPDLAGLDTHSVDLIGDVHGCATTLRQLLEQLGYRYQRGAYRHPQRHAVFIGDLIDRGNYIRECLHLVQDMVAAGSAHCLIGNHEYNALVYSTAIDRGEGAEYLRSHTPGHTRQLRATLDQFAAYPEEWQAFIGWFRELLIYIETDTFRAVHACWDNALLRTLKRQGIQDFSEIDFLAKTVERGTFEWQVADRLLRGTSLLLPDEQTLVGSDGLERRAYRTKFWVAEPQTHGDVEFQPDPIPRHIAEQTLTDQEKERLRYYGRDQKPLFVGHYWQSGRPKPVCDNIACLDYSAVRRGKLVAYRMDGEQILQPDKFVWVDVDPRDISAGR